MAVKKRQQYSIAEAARRLGIEPEELIARIGDGQLKAVAYSEAADDFMEVAAEPLRELCLAGWSETTAEFNFPPMSTPLGKRLRAAHRALGRKQRLRLEDLRLPASEFEQIELELATLDNTAPRARSKKLPTKKLPSNPSKKAGDRRGHHLARIQDEIVRVAAEVLRRVDQGEIEPHRTIRYSHGAVNCTALAELVQEHRHLSDLIKDDEKYGAGEKTIRKWITKAVDAGRIR